ncbi:GumC domain-containing protein [Bythopirellula goksoeyrii]|uniref:Chain length determinant protein n=1 Tax=Bythopirellula goksoeyrii TaxID=1400387 RepID=A0A5B9QI89_9BACT|nr:hypothetical protein [Bythopirellula goksoeyrii]QEG37275.1 Chain length determinant protein [Bythopirellula goksoeyrii]
MVSDRFFLFRPPVFLFLSLVLAILVSAFLFWWLPQPFSVTAYMQVDSNTSSMKFLNPEQRFSEKEFEIFKETQLTLLKSQFVLMAALNRGDIRELNVVVKNRPDELTWLQDELQASFPGESKILMISYEGNEDPDEMKKIIDAVVEAYMNEIVAADRIEEFEEMAGLDTVLRQLEVELRSKLEKYYMLEQELESNATANEGKQDDVNEISSRSSKPKGLRNGELRMLEQEIDELEELRRELSLYLRRLKIMDMDNSSVERIKVMQNAFNTEEIDPDMRYGIIALGGVGTFVLVCVILALMGKCFGTRSV